MTEEGKLNIGDKMQIQYTRAKARSYDKRFVSYLCARYNVAIYLMIIVACMAGGAVTGILVF